MLLDARDLGSDVVLSADVCIIGAGAAGITLAMQLDGTGLGVLLLESGDFDLDKATQALYKGKVIGLPIDPNIRNAGLDLPRLRYFGGTTNHWSGYCRPFTALDFEKRDYVPRSGWPFARDVLDPFYARAQDVIGLGPYEYSTRYWQDAGLLEQPFLEGDSLQHQVVQIAPRPKLGDVYRDTIVASEDVRLCIHANVTRIALSDDGAHVSNLDVATLSGVSFGVQARVYVLATGGLEVPRLLLASNDGRPAGIGNENDLVGRHFMEHVNIAAGVAVLALDSAALAPYTPKDGKVVVGDEERDVTVQAVLLLAETVQRASALRSCEVTLEFPLGIGSQALAQLFPRVQHGIALMRAGGLEPGIAPAIRVLCEQEPNPESRVTLTRAKDRLGMPRLQLDWRLTRDDRTSLLRTVQFIGAELARRKLGRVRLDIGGFTDLTPEPNTALDYTVNTGSHHMGTARMHASPRSGVVDTNCRLHSVQNLYVAGSAVFPTSGANTPTLTIVALALRLADHLRTALA